MNPIRIAVACAANNEDLESMLVLEYSIRKHTTRPVEITWMRLSRDPSSPFYSDPFLNRGWATREWATPFTGFRWAVPALYGFQGKAIYMDSDFIVMDDIGKLYDEEISSGRRVVAKTGSAIRFCCSLWDCREGPTLEELMSDPQAHTRMTRIMAKGNLVQPFTTGDWNALDITLPPDLNAPQVKAIHYTVVPQQLQFKHALPRLASEGKSHWYKGKTYPHARQDLQKLFDELYEEARASGVSVEDYRTEPYGKYQLRG